MSRSRKKNPGCYITYSASRPGVRKKEKTAYNRHIRRAGRRGKYYYKVREAVDVWSMAQDGDYILLFKYRNEDPEDSVLRKECSRK